MKLTLWILGCCLSVCSSLFAGNSGPLLNQKSPLPPSKTLTLPGYCEIEIINNSFDDIRVYGAYDDGTPLQPFSIYSFEAPYYIPLYYYGYCHAGMNLYIDTFSGYHVYAGYTQRRSTIQVVPYPIKKGKVKATVTVK